MNIDCVLGPKNEKMIQKDKKTTTLNAYINRSERINMKKDDILSSHTHRDRRNFL